MDLFFKAAAGCFIALILYLVLAKQNKDISVALSICVCCMIFSAVAYYFGPIVELIRKLRDIGRLNSETLSIILRAAGIGMIAEIGSTICKDAGNDTLGKTLQLLASMVILWLAVPIFDNLILLIESIIASI